MYWPPTGLLGVCIELPQPPRVDAVGADRYADGSPCRTVSYIAMGLTHQQRERVFKWNGRTRGSRLELESRPGVKR